MYRGQVWHFSIARFLFLLPKSVGATKNPRPRRSSQHTPASPIPELGAPGSRKQPKTTHLTVSRIQYLLFMHFRSSLVYPCNTLQDRSPAACVCAQNNHIITMEGMARWLHSAVLAMLCTKHTKQCLSLCYATGERWLDHAVLDFHVWLEKDSRRKIARYTVHSTKEDLSKN